MSKCVYKILFTGVLTVILGSGINYAFAAPPSAPEITTQPVSVTVTAPDIATFTVVANSSTPITYQWFQSEPGKGKFTAISGATFASYTTPPTTAAMNGASYRCEVSNSSRTVKSDEATLTVNSGPEAPTITTHPADVTVVASETATFTVEASGSPTPNFQWMEKSPGASTFTAIVGATEASYTTPATMAAMDGTEYNCVVSNSEGSVTSNVATLTVITGSAAPSIISQPLSVTVQAPDKATFTVEATGLPTLTYQWEKAEPGFKNFSSISGATAPTYSTTSTNIDNSGRRYQCVVSNSEGSVTSDAATLTVAGLPVVEVTAPADDSSFPVGSDLTIKASASETNGTITSVSFYNGAAFLGASNAEPYEYTITNAPVGIYTLTAVATDAFGTSATSDPVTMTVHGLPEVTLANPPDQSTVSTGSVNITAIAKEDFGTITSVAFYNGTELLGTVASTSQAFTYSWTNIPSGTYDLTAVATDAVGATATSSPVTVTIDSRIFTTAVDDNVVSITDALDNTTFYAYDNLNRLLRTTYADGSSVSYTYDAFGNQTSVTDQRGNVLTKTYDAYDRLSQIQNPNGGITQFDYDTESRLLTLTDANGQETRYSYDPNGRVQNRINALNLATVFTYDPVGNIATREDANGNTTNYAYDALNRLTDTAYPDGTSIANIYDALGRRIAMTDTLGQTTYSYDALSRLLTKDGPAANDTITYTYDSEGNRLTSIDQNSRTITNTYDALNRLASVQDQNGTTSYGYDADSNIVSVTSPNGVVEKYTYDSLDRVLSAVTQNGSEVLFSYSNVYDIAGVIKKKIFSDGSWATYTYDALNQLLNETRQTSTSTIYDNSYAYDPVGNRLTWTKSTTLGGFWSVDYLNVPSSVLTSMTNAGYGDTADPSIAVFLVINYTNDAANRLTGWNETISVGTVALSVQAAYAYDDNGNRISEVVSGGVGDPTARQTSYAYDFENRLNQLIHENIPDIVGTQTDKLTYNGEGFRTQVVLNDNATTGNTVTTDYLYDNSNILVERDDAGNTKTYTRAIGFPGGIGGLIAQNFTDNGTPVAQYYHYDDLGSVVSLTGDITNNYSYDAFGNLLTSQISGDSNRFLFSTKEFDSRAGLYYFGARYYDPEVGRWLTPDPLGMIDGPNVYAYVGNNPINYIDPFGLWDVRTRGLGNPITRFMANLYYHKNKIKGQHWQMFYDDGTNVGYLGDDSSNKSSPRIGPDEDSLLENYSDTAIVHGENDNLMKIAEIRATNYWENEYKKGQRYHHPVLFDKSRKFDCQEFIIRMLYEYNNILRVKAGKEQN